MDETEDTELLATPRPHTAIPTTWTATPSTPAASTEPPLDTRDGDGSGGEGRSAASPTQSRQSALATELAAPKPTVALRWNLVKPVITAAAPLHAGITLSNAAAYEFDIWHRNTVTVGENRLESGVRLFVPNPADLNSYLRTDAWGILHIKSIVDAEERELDEAPILRQRIGAPATIDENAYKIVEADWSADGRRFSFRIDPHPSLDNALAGLWHWQPDPGPENRHLFPLLYDCASETRSGCALMSRPSPPLHWKTISAEWSPLAGSNRLLLTLQLPLEGRNALAVMEANPDPAAATRLPPLARYEYGSWNPDGNGITVSGRRPDGRVIIGVVDSSLGNERIILDGTRQGLWLRDAVQLPATGHYVALGRPGKPQSGPVALYGQQGFQLSDFIGDAPPEAVRWYPDRRAVVVTVKGKQYTVTASFTSIGVDVYNDFANPFNPLHSPFHSNNAEQIPNAVVIGNEYNPSQQLRITAPVLALHAEPRLQSQVLEELTAGDYVIVYAGPFENENRRWWWVNTKQNAFGWLATVVAGAPTVERAR